MPAVKPMTWAAMASRNTAGSGSSTPLSNASTSQTTGSANMGSTNRGSAHAGSAVHQLTVADGKSEISHK